MVVATNSMAQIVQRPASAGGSATCSSFSSTPLMPLPVCQSAIELAVHGKIRALIRKLCSQRFVQFHAQARAVTGEHHSILEGVLVPEHRIGFVGVRHVF